jgi:carbon-monoxide dehydrogenase large subunit
MSLRGTPVPRREDRALLMTGGSFVADLDLPGALVVHYVTSPQAHARITRCDIAAARQAPGVVDVVTAADLDGLGPMPQPSPDLPTGMARPLLAADVVRFVGEAVVAVVAVDATAAADAVELVEIDYETLPVVVDLESAAGDGVLLFPEIGTNVALRLDAPELVPDFAGCEVVAEVRVVNNRLAAAPMEPRVAASRWEGERLIHHASCQGVHPVRATLAKVYGLEPTAVRVVARDVGGSFGAKGTPHCEELLLPFLARRVGRPVRWVPNRSADMVGLHHGRGQVQYLRIGGDRSGRIHAYEAHVLQDAGAYPAGAASLPANTRAMLTGCYDIPTAGFRSESVVTNTVPTGAYRGAGRPEAAAAIERAVDVFAAAIGMDPVEVRRRNFVGADRFPFRTLSGMTYDSGDYRGALDRAVGAADLVALRAEQDRRRTAGDRTLLGIGVATYVERTAGILRPDYGAVELLPDGRFVARTGSTPYGQGHHTAWAMLVADRLGVDVNDVEVRSSDTDEIPRGGQTGGSRSLQSNGVALWQAAGELVELARRLAADRLEAAPEDVVHDPGVGRFHVAGTPSISISWSDVAATAEASTEDGEGRRLLHAETDFAAAGPTFPFGAHVAVVEVDTETGAVRLRRLVACDDAGVILNPLLADGQVHGGLAQGAAQALLEGFVYDEAGNPLTANFADYPVISAAELPFFERVVMETPSPVNELGAKGIGESGTVGATPAVQNAVVDALAHLGVTHVDMPCTPESVWRTIRAATT